MLCWMEKAEHENDFPPALGEGECQKERERERERTCTALSGVSALWDREPQPGSGTNTQPEPAVCSLPAGITTQTGRLSKSLINIAVDSSELFTDYLEDSVKGRRGKCQESASRHLSLSLC